MAEYIVIHSNDYETCKTLGWVELSIFPYIITKGNSKTELERWVNIYEQGLMVLHSDGSPVSQEFWE